MNVYTYVSSLLFSYMMRPKNKDERIIFLYKTIIKYFSILEIQHPNNSACIAENLARHIAHIGTIGDFTNAMLKPSSEYFDQIFYDCFARGYTCGFILNTVIANKVSISSAIDAHIAYSDSVSKNIESPYSGINMKFTKVNIENNIWPIYKNVSVYWAALLHAKPFDEILQCAFLDFSAFDVNNDRIKATGFEGFCGLVDEYIRLATTFKAPRAKGPILASKEVFSVMEMGKRLLSKEI